MEGLSNLLKVTWLLSGGAGVCPHMPGSEAYLKIYLLSKDMKSGVSQSEAILPPRVFSNV